MLMGCGENIEDYKTETPTFKIQDYFVGPLKAYGLLKDYRGRVTRRFEVTMEGSWTGNKGTLTEHFIFNDGERQDRTWSFDLLDDQSFEGTAHDVIGTAQGKQMGNTVNMKYVMRIPVSGSTYDITIDDYLYRLDEKRVLNVSKLKKFGITVASLFIYFEKP